MRRRVAAAAAGMVLLMMTGCASSAAPEGDALYSSGVGHHREFASGLHSVLMAVHEDTWAVRQNDYGAAPIPCNDGTGYSFHSIREAIPDGIDADELTARAVTALKSLNLEVTSQVFGSGEREQRAVVGVGGSFERVTVTVTPSTGVVLVTASSDCSPGNAHDLGRLVFAQSMARDQWRLLPATEGPDSVPQFYFPADGPLYYDESGDPIEPQPVITDVPVAPYGG